MVPKQCKSPAKHDETMAGCFMFEGWDYLYLPNTFLLCEVNQCEPGTTEALGIHTMALTRISNSGTWCSTLSKTQRLTSLRNHSCYCFRFHQMLPDVFRFQLSAWQFVQCARSATGAPAGSCRCGPTCHGVHGAHEHGTSNGHPGFDPNNAPILAFRHPLCPPWFIFGEVSEPNFTAPDNMDNQIKFLQKLRSPNFLEFLLRFRNLRL
jgi:hypothetical protein